jgi:hypothetical protein
MVLLHMFRYWMREVITPKHMQTRSTNTLEKLSVFQALCIAGIGLYEVKIFFKFCKFIFRTT